MDVGAVDRLIETSRRIACEQAAELSLIHEIASAAPVADFAAVEVACALTLTRFAAEDLVQLAAQLCDRLPDVLGALSNGDISQAKARVFADVLAVLEVDSARKVAALVLPKAPARTTGQLREMLRRKALAADPAFTTARRDRSSSLRSVQLHADNDGTASLTAFGLDAARSAAAMQRIGQLASSRKLDGEAASLGQLRADVLLELLEGRHAGASRGVINLTVSLETLARFNNDPASLGSYGLVAADIARQWTEAHPGYQWSYGIHDPAGTLLQQGLTRARANADTHAHAGPNTSANTGKNAQAGAGAQAQGTANTATFHEDAAKHDLASQRQAKQSQPAGSAGPPKPAPHDRAASAARPPAQDPRDRAASAAMTRWIRLRDKTCRAPGCRVPAWQSDLDHNQRYIDGRLTTHDNLCALCRLHHRAKDEGGWVLVQTRPGHFIWTSPLGRIYEVQPEPP